VSLSAITQAWLAGLFIGKITRGVYSGGFLFSALFTAVTIVSIVIVQSHVIDINGIFMTQ